ncbi:MAG TPA: hypothetical protein VD999_03315 [Vitreimonas sp.]|nr:hypothetical protein [Vitreimonas sp.]
MSTPYSPACQTFTDLRTYIAEHSQSLLQDFATLYTTGDRHLYQDLVTRFGRFNEHATSFMAEWVTKHRQLFGQFMVYDNPSLQPHEVEYVTNNLHYNSEKGYFQIFGRLDCNESGIKTLPSLLKAVLGPVSIHPQMRSLNKISECSTLFLGYNEYDFEAPDLVMVGEISDSRSHTRLAPPARRLKLSFPRLKTAPTLTLSGHLDLEFPVLNYSDDIHIATDQPLIFPELQTFKEGTFYTPNLHLPNCTEIEGALYLSSSVENSVKMEVFDAPKLKKVKKLHAGKVGRFNLPALEVIDDHLSITHAVDNLYFPQLSRVNHLDLSGFYNYPRTALQKLTGKAVPTQTMVEYFFNAFPKLTQLGEEIGVSLFTPTADMAEALKAEFKKRHIQHDGEIQARF